MRASMVPSHVIAVLTLIIVVAGTGVCRAELREDVSSEGWTGTVDWREGYVYASAIGTVDMAEMANDVQAEQVSRVTATHLAYRALYEMIGKIGLDATSVYRREIMVDDLLKIETKGELEQVHVWRSDFSWTPQGSPKATVTVRMPLYEGLSRSAANWAGRQPGLPKFDADIPAGGSTHTSVIVDARNVDVQPCMCPRILTNEGRREVYGPGSADQDTAAASGFAAYAGSLEEARNNKKAGRNPLVISAISTRGVRRGDLVISESDALAVMRADMHNSILKDCRVIIVAR